MFHALCGSDDLRSEELWESICQRRWSGKLNKKIEEGGGIIPAFDKLARVQH